MDEATIQRWTDECLAPITEHLDRAMLNQVMSKILWAMTQAYHAGYCDGADADHAALTLENVVLAIERRWPTRAEEGPGDGS